MDSVGDTVEQLIDEIRSGKKTLKGRLTRMEKTFDQARKFGGLSDIVRKIEIVDDGLDEFQNIVDEVLDELHDVESEYKQEQRKHLLRSLKTYAQEHELTFEGTRSAGKQGALKCSVGPYRIRMEDEDKPDVHFSECHVGSIFSTASEDVKEEMDEIRASVEVNTANFLDRLKAAYEKSADRPGAEASLPRVVRQFIVDLQPEGFWQDPDPDQLHSYGRANFAWEMRRAVKEEGRIPFRLKEATVRANVSAKAGTGESDVVMLYLNDRIKAYSRMEWNQEQR